MAPTPAHHDDGLRPVDAVANPIDRFAHLRRETKIWLENLDEEDITALRDVVRSYKRASVIGWFFKWLVITMASVFAAAVTFGEGVTRVYGWILGR